MRYPNRWTVADWTFYEVTDHDFPGELADKPLYGFTGAVPDGTAAGKPKLGELYASLEHALVAAVGEKYTGRRGAGGSGVDTAAGWFMRMIGADQLVPADGARLILAGAAEVAGVEHPSARGGRMERALREDGYVLAKVNTGS